ncbi:hypothetical protein ACJMK2_021124 [Sinanodonta woodiana]|uniref:Sodium-coupled monocarboxylate transporter 1 n=1 Tax=Sinanodonta woodiana TaxID=1069815 RepID=A0ABD3U3J0_SINWO
MEPSVEVRTFHPADYAVFVGVLVISAAIGIYHALAGGKQKSTKEFLMADQNMASLPVALSVLASFFSASTLLGTPAEIYQHGTQYWICVFGAIMAPVTGAFLFGPLFFRLKLVSVFQYLETRYGSKSVRLYGAAVFIIRTTIGMGIVLYGPSTALNSVTPLPTWSVIIIIGVVCTFYTTLGGLKAVIWTDVFQTIVMFAGMLAVLIKGCNVLGGVERVWEIAYKGDRIEFFNFNPDPHVRHTFWSLIIGIYFVWLPPYTVDQQMVQRFSSARSLRQAKVALLLNVPGMFLLISLCCMTGVVMFSYYAEGCDPLTGSKRAGNPNQLLPVFVMDLLHEYPGLPGLFVACLFSGALSSISSMMNSLATVTWEDFLKLKFSNVPDERATLITKVLAALYGCIGVGMAFVVERLGGTVLQASLTLNGAAGAPLVGLFILGACFTSANWIGALVGGVLGFAFSLWVSIGTYISKPVKLHDTPMSLKNCPMINTSTASNSTTVFPWTDQTRENRTKYGIHIIHMHFLPVQMIIIKYTSLICIVPGIQYALCPLLAFHYRGMYANITRMNPYTPTDHDLCSPVDQPK